MLHDMFNDHLLQSFIETFYGYGDYHGRYWFVGMEEGGGTSYEGISGRLTAWEVRGKHELEDLAGYHSQLGVTKYLGEQARSQPTWNKLIRILLSINGDTPTLQGVKSYQRTQLGRWGANHCLIELLPLPSPSIGKWLYGQHSDLSFLTTRQTYMEHCAEPRARHIKARIEERKPSAVIFYSFHGWYRQWWKLIAGVEFAPITIGTDVCYIGSNNQTVFAIVKHPVTKGITRDYFHQVGREVARLSEK
ncbi:MAG TPA: hypothetical protein VEX13_08910 [Chloroflexia bacterium]|nr:hypothetical protein [Chloroflexia bacterium]